MALMAFRTLIFISLALTSFNIFAWVVEPEISFDAVKGEIGVYNDLGSPVKCIGQAIGQRAYGPNVTTELSRLPIMPARWAYAYVVTDANNPFVDVWGEIFCNFY